MSKEASAESVRPSGSRARRATTFVGGAITAALILAIGLYGGWLVGKKGSGGAQSHGEHGEHAETPEEHAGHAHASRISPQTLKNLGVEFGELKTSDFVETREIAALVEDRPDARRPVYSPIGGRVVTVLVRPGQVVRAGDPVAEIARDPFPRPSLSLTDAVLKPLNEDYHRAIADLRSSSQSLAIASEELARVRKILGTAEGSTALPSRTEIDLSYEERRSRKALESARIEAHRHGLTDDEVAAVEADGHAPSDQPPVRRILERNRLWSPEASALHDALPAAVRELPYSLALLGDLVGSHALSPELVALVKARPALAAAFLDVAGLVQQGVTAASLSALDDAGALASQFVVRAPKDAPDWDVTAVAVRDGAHVEAGSTIAELADDRFVWLRAVPTGSDVALLETALREQSDVTSEPMTAGAGPHLKGLRVYRMDENPGSDQGGHSSPGASALFVVGNLMLKETSAAGAPTTRTWALRSGTRYTIHVPVRSISGRFVLPSEAVVPRGPDSVLVLREGASFRLVPVHVEHADAATAVIANDGAVFPGDTVVLRGAYALSLALQAGSGGAADPHAGHHH